MLFGNLNAAIIEISYFKQISTQKRMISRVHSCQIFLFGNMINQTLPKYYNGTFNILLSRTFSWDTDRATFVSEEH